jgi:GAF domain-containing protein
LSALSLPLVAGDTSVGALILYARTANGFSTDDEALGLDLAGAAAIVLANSSAYWQAAELGDQLGQAMQSGR